MVLKNEYALTFYSYKMYHTFGHVHCDIFILKQNNLLIIIESFQFITLKAGKQSKIVLRIKLTF